MNLQNIMWKKPVAKDFALYDLIYTKCPVKAHLSRQRADQWLCGTWYTNGNWLQMNLKELILGDGNVLKVIIVMVTQLYEYTKDYCTF